jgi:hypothetical protein
LSNPVTVLGRFGFWLARYRGNGLSDETWAPVLCVDGRIVAPLLTEMRRAGIPAHCTRLRRGWRLPPHHSEWCVWVGYSSCRKGQERLAEIIPLLIGSLRGGAAAA